MAAGSGLGERLYALHHEDHAGAASISGRGSPGPCEVFIVGAPIVSVLKSDKETIFICGDFSQCCQKLTVT